MALPGLRWLSFESESSAGSARLGAIATLAITVLMGSAALAMSVKEPAPPALEITAFAAAVEGESTVDARIVVVNNSNERIEGESGWLLYVVGGEPWEDRAYQSSSQPLDLQAGESATLLWSEIAPVATGSYEIKAWANIETDDESQPSDSSSVAGLVLRIHNPGGLLRLDHPAFGVDVVGVEAPESPTFEVAVAATVGNKGYAPQLVEVRAEILETTPEDPLWWKATIVGSLASQIEIEAGAELTVTMRQPMVLMPGEYGVRIVVTQEDGAVLVDQVLGSDLLMVPSFEPGVVREVLPSGPLMVTMIDADTDWVADDAAIVTVEVLNRSTDDVGGVLWWHLADPGDPEPWAYAAATSLRLERAFGPGESRVVRLATDGLVPVGLGYELSIWVHTGSGENSEHSDGVRFSQRIDVQMPGGQENGES